MLLTNFTIYCAARKIRGGGVMIAVNNDICSERISWKPNLEVLSIGIKTKSTSLIICDVYMPPNPMLLATTL